MAFFTNFAGMYIDCHTHCIKSDADISVLNFYPEEPIPALVKGSILSCGIHPWYIDPNKIQHDLQRIEEFCQQNKIAAIGECGLDKNTKDMNLQKRVFEQQIALSEKYGLPLIIHAVKTHHLILEKKQTKAKQTWVIHGYHGSVQTAQHFIDKEIFISFGENLIKYPDKFKKILNQIDLNFVLLETDDSNLGIREIYTEAAKLLDLDLDMLKIKIEENFKRIFL